MISVSDKYMTASHALSRQTDIKGKILLPTGGIVNFTANDLLQGSTSYSNKCLSNETFELGGAYIGEFKTTLKSNIDRYALFGAVITVEFLMKLEEGLWETIDIGQFTINSANRVGKYVEIEAFDNLSLLETEITEATSGNAITLFNWICEKCKIANGMTDSAWEKLVNLDVVFAFNQNDYDTYRDLASELATVCGGFVTVDGFGALVIKTFGSEAVDTVGDTMRTDSKFEDYICKYTSISMKVAGELYSASADITGGLTMELPDNKLIEANTPETIEIILTNLLNKISIFTYVPCKVDMSINPAYELGDMLAWTGYNTGGETINSIITSINWTFRDSMQIESVGENSKIVNAKSGVAKSVDGVSSQVTAKELKTILYTNGEDLDIGRQRTMIVDISFAAVKNELAVPLLSGQFKMNVTEPAIYRLIYEFNGAELPFRPEEAVYHTGPKIVTFIKSLESVETTQGNKVRVYLETLPIEITDKTLVQDEETGIYTLEDVTTMYDGEAKILMGDLEAQLQATNLSFAEQWDGNFDIYEEIAPVTITTANVDFNDEVDLSVIEYLKHQISEPLIPALNRNSQIMCTDVLNAIMDYDVIPYHEMTFEKLENDSSDEGNLETDGVISWSPSADYATAIKGYYMQLPNGQSTRISATSTSQIQIYLMTSIATETYKIEKVGENNTIKYTSNGDRFWVIIAGANRQENGNYKITATQIDDVNAIYIKVNNGYINGDTTKTEGSFRKGDTITLTANLPPQGLFFKSWQTSNTDVSRKATFTIRTSFDGEYTATYSDVETAPAPLAFIGEFKRTLVINNFTCNLETDSEDYTIQKIAFIYTKDRAYIERLTYENCDGEHVHLASEITSDFPNGMYQFAVPIENQTDDFYVRVEIKYTLDGMTTSSTYSNTVETHFLDSVEIETYSASYENPEEFEYDSERVKITSDGFKQYEKIVVKCTDETCQTGDMKSAIIPASEWYVKDGDKYLIDTIEII